MYETSVAPSSPVPTIVNRSNPNWIKSYVEKTIKIRGIELARPITATMASCHVFGFYIAGGAFYKGELNDVDIWPTPLSKEPYSKLVALFKNDNRPYGDMVRDGIKYQLCLSPVFAELKDLVESFDFAHCKVGVTIFLLDNGEIIAAIPYASPDFIAAMALQTTWYTPGHNWPLNSLARLGKVARKLNLSVEETKDIGNQIVSDILNRGLSNCTDPTYLDWLKNYGKAA